MTTNNDRALIAAARKMLRQYAWLADTQTRAESAVSQQAQMLSVLGASDEAISQIRQRAEELAYGAPGGGTNAEIDAWLSGLPAWVAQMSVDGLTTR